MKRAATPIVSSPLFAYNVLWEKLMARKGSPPDIFKKAGMAMALGTLFLSYILAGGLIGYYLDKWLGTTPWMFFVFFFIGTGGAIYNVFRMAARLK